MKIDKIIISKKKFDLLVLHALEKDDKKRAKIMNDLLTLTSDENAIVYIEDRS